MDEGATGTDFEGDAWIYAGIKRDTKFIVGFAVGKRTQDTCDHFLMRILDGMELPTPSNPIEFYSDGNDQYREGLKKIYDSTGYRYGQLSKTKSAGRLTKITRQWVVGEGNLGNIRTSQIENMNGVARGCHSHLVRKTKRVDKMYEMFQMYRNFMKQDKNKITPAMKECLQDAPMDWVDFLSLSIRYKIAHYPASIKSRPESIRKIPLITLLNV